VVVVSDLAVEGAKRLSSQAIQLAGRRDWYGAGVAGFGGAAGGGGGEAAAGLSAGGGADEFKTRLHISNKLSCLAPAGGGRDTEEAAGGGVKTGAAAAGGGVEAGAAAAGVGVEAGAGAGAAGAAGAAGGGVICEQVKAPLAARALISCCHITTNPAQIFSVPQGVHEETVYFSVFPVGTKYTCWLPPSLALTNLPFEVSNLSMPPCPDEKTRYRRMAATAINNNCFSFIYE